MPRTLKRERQRRIVERGFVPTRQEGQLLVAAYQLAVPLMRRTLASARPAAGTPGARDVRRGQINVAAGGSSS